MLFASRKSKALKRNVFLVRLIARVLRWLSLSLTNAGASAPRSNFISDDAVQWCYFYAPFRVVQGNSFYSRCRYYVSVLLNNILLLCLRLPTFMRFPIIYYKCSYLTILITRIIRTPGDHIPFPMVIYFFNMHRTHFRQAGTPHPETAERVRWAH